MGLSTLIDKVRLFIIAMAGMSAVLSFLIVHQYENSFRQHHQGLAEHAVQTVNAELTQLLNNIKYDTRLFVSHNQEHLWQMSRYPEDETTYIEIRNLLAEYFPGHYAFTLTDKEGNPYYSDMGEAIGDQCEESIDQLLSENADDHSRHEGIIMVHPGPGEYHFDIAVP